MSFQNIIILIVNKSRAKQLNLIQFASPIERNQNTARPKSYRTWIKDECNCSKSK